MSRIHWPYGASRSTAAKFCWTDQDATLLPERRRSKITDRLFHDPMRGSAPGMTIEENLALAAAAGLDTSAAKTASASAPRGGHTYPRCGQF